RAFIGHFRRSEPIDSVRPGLAADFHQLVADLVDGHVPGDTGPLAVDQLHRVTQTAIAMDDFAHRGAFGAMRAAIDRAVGARLLADPHAIGDFRCHSAADRAVCADALADRDLCTGRRRRTGLRFAHAAERAPAR